MKRDERAPAWVPCDCGGFWCSIHDEHVHDCPCPPIEDWEVDPYQAGGVPAANERE